MAITNINSDLCIRCGVCALACAVDVIRMDKETKTPYIAYPQECMLCDMCTWHCPVKAITVTAERVKGCLMSWG